MSGPADQLARPGDAYKMGALQALSLAQNGDPAGGRKILKAALAGSRIDTDGLLALAHIYNGSGRGKAARTVLRGVLRREPTNTGAFYSLMIAYINDRNIDAAIGTAIAFFDAGGRVDYAHEGVRAILARVAAWRSQEFPQNASLPYTLARIYLLGAEFQKAKDFFLVAPERQYADTEIAALDVLLGGSLPEEGRYNWAVLPSKSLRQIVIGKLVEAGRSDEVFSLLDHKQYVRSEQRSKRPEGANARLYLSVMPKAGSSYLLGAFAELSGLPIVDVTYWFGKQDNVIIPGWMDVAAEVDAVSAGPCPATPHNIREIERHSLPVFLHIRDPRDQVWSMYRWVEEMTEIERRGHLPAHYSSSPQEDRVRMVYETFFPQIMNWVASWKTYIVQKRNPVFVSKYEDFTKDNVATIKSLLGLCNISLSSETLVAKPDAVHHKFRQGGVGGWRKAKSSEIVAIIDKHWNDDAMSYFGYTR